MEEEVSNPANKMFVAVGQKLLDCLPADDDILPEYVSACFCEAGIFALGLENTGFYEKADLETWYGDKNTMEYGSAEQMEAVASAFSGHRLKF